MDLDKLTYVMGRVAATAHTIDLPHVGRGFYGYQQVTLNTVQHLDQHFFDDPDKIARTMPVFAELAFAPLRHHVYGEHDKVGAWKPMYYNHASRTAPASVNMSEFLRAHVDRDLAFALLETDTQPEHKDDYTAKMNTILSQTGRELLPTYVEAKSFLKQLGIEKLGLSLVLRDLYKARDDAWEAFEELKEADGDIHQINLIDERLRQKAATGLLSGNKFASYVIDKTTRVPQNS